MPDYKAYHAHLFCAGGMSISEAGLPTAAHVLVQVVHQGLRLREAAHARTSKQERRQTWLQTEPQFVVSD
jgi:hypothetical protein